MLVTILICVIASVGMVPLPRAIRLTVIAAAYPFQLFVPGAYLSLAEACVLGASICLAFQAPRELAATLRSPLVSTLALLWLSATAALAWTDQSAIMAGTNSVARLLIFIMLAVLVAVEMNDGGADAVRIPVISAAPGVVTQSVLCMVFITAPGLEDAYLRSTLGQVLGGNAVPALFAGERNNVLDPLKSGGFFVNGNVAGMYGFVAALLFTWAGLRWRSLWFFVVAAIAVAGSLSTGSKTPFVLLPLIAVLIVASVWRHLRSRPRTVLLSSAAGVAAVAVAGVALLGDRAVTTFENLLESLSQRNEQWSLIPRVWAESPLLGLGYDGWRRMAQEVLGENWPPHNLLVKAWADAGVPHLLLTLMVLTLLTITSVRTIRRAASAAEALQCVLPSAALFWVVAHGMADNTTIYGDPRTGFFVALAIAAITTGTVSGEPNSKARR